MPFEPPFFAPMQAVAASLPLEAGWAYELKWDGMRMLAANKSRTTELKARSGIDMTTTFPELASLASEIGAVGDGPTVLDGEVITFVDGKPSFEQLQHRIHVSEPSQSLQNQIPVVYIVFDLLVLDGQAMFDVDYQTRRSLLREVVPDSDRWKVPSHAEGQSSTLVALSKTLGLEGVIAKKLRSKYRPGKRSSSWVKVKNFKRQEFVIGGWLEGEGELQNKIGSLLIGTWEGDRLVFAGAVGSGISDRTREMLAQHLVETTSCPFDPVPETTRTPHWARSQLTAEVSYLSWASGGKLRQPTLKGLRSDKDPKTVVKEPTDQ